MLQQSIGITPGENLSVLGELNVLEKPDLKQYAHILCTMLTEGTMQIPRTGKWRICKCGKGYLLLSTRH